MVNGMTMDAYLQTDRFQFDERISVANGALNKPYYFPNGFAVTFFFNAKTGKVRAGSLTFPVFAFILLYNSIKFIRFSDVIIL